MQTIAIGNFLAVGDHNDDWSLCRGTPHAPVLLSNTCADLGVADALMVSSTSRPLGSVTRLGSV